MNAAGGKNMALSMDHIIAKANEIVKNQREPVETIIEKNTQKVHRKSKIFLAIILRL